MNDNTYKDPHNFGKADGEYSCSNSIETNDKMNANTYQGQCNSPVNQILRAAQERTGLPSVFVLRAEILKDGTLWFAYTFDPNLQQEPVDIGIPEGVFDELVSKSDEMYLEAAHYIELQWKENGGVQDE